jgi:AcrR family transcriptional regulator
MDVREALLEAAAKVFAELGMRGATTKRIAQEAGVNEVTLFRHFKSKDDLLQAALEAYARRSQARTLPDHPVHPREELIEWCRAHHRDLHKHRSLIRKTMSEHEEHPAHCATGMQVSVRVADELKRYLNGLKDEGFAAGTWDALAATNMLIGALFSDAMGRDTMPERYPYSMRDAVELYVDLLLAAIGAKPAPRSGRGRHA